MATFHVSEQNVLAKAVGGARFGGEQSLMVAGDLSSLSAAKAAIDTSDGKLHSSQRTFGIRAKSALDLLHDYDSTYESGTTLLKSTMIALSSQRNGAIAPRF